MKKTFFAALVLSFLAVVAVGYPYSVKAGSGMYNLVDEHSSHAVVTNGANSTYGYGSGTYRSYKSSNCVGTGCPTSEIVWKCIDSFGSEFHWHTYVAIPGQYGTLDGSYIYRVDNTNNTEDFNISVNQENFYNQWVYLGWSLGTGGVDDVSKCYVATGNTNGAGTPTREFWMDHMKYWPNNSSTPPAYTHGW